MPRDDRPSSKEPRASTGLLPQDARTSQIAADAFGDSACRWARRTFDDLCTVLLERRRTLQRVHQSIGYIVQRVHLAGRLHVSAQHDVVLRSTETNIECDYTVLYRGSSAGYRRAHLRPEVRTTVSACGYKVSNKSRVGSGYSLRRHSRFTMGAKAIGHARSHPSG